MNRSTCVYHGATLGRCELVLAPPLAGPSPDYRLAADLIAANPVERLFLYVRVVTILDEEVRRVLTISRCLADQGILFQLLSRHGAAMRQLPRVEIHRGIVLDVDYVAPALEDKCLEPLFAELFCCPPARNSRAHDDRIEGGGLRGHA